MKRSRSTTEFTWRLVGLGLVLVWLLLWEWSVRAGLGRNIFSPPSTVLTELYRSLLVTGELRSHMWATVTRLIGGFATGAVPALLLGFVMGRNRSACLRYGPVLGALGLIPVLATLPLWVVVFGLWELGKWTAVGAAVFYPILHCTIMGIRNSPAAQHTHNGRAGNLRRADWRYGAGPWIFTGLKLAVVFGLATLIGVETFASRNGLGFEIAVAGAKLDFTRLYVGMFAAAFLVYALWLCLTVIEFVLSRRISLESPLGEDSSGGADTD